VVGDVVEQRELGDEPANPQARLEARFEQRELGDER
jgi:hypothetical protein